MDVERRLISRAILDGQIETLVSRGIGSIHFDLALDGTESEHAAVFKTMVSHMRTYNAAPSRDAVLHEHPDYRLDPCEDTLDYLIDRFVSKVKRRETIKALDGAIKQIDAPQTDVDTLLFEAAQSVVDSTPASSQVSKLSDATSRVDRYKQYLSKGRAPGVTLGYSDLDRIVLGVQDYEVVTVAAPSAWGKSTLLQNLCLNSYLSDATVQTPLFISLEMDADALLRRFDAMATRIKASSIKGLEIAETDEEMRRWEQWAERAGSAPNDILVVDDIYHATSDRILAEVMRHKPTCVFVDYVQLMEGPGDNSYLRVGNAIKGLKRIARMLRIPVFTAAQTNRTGFKDGVTEDNIADSIEIFRSSDILLGLERTDEMDKERKALLKLVKNRDAPKGHTTIWFDWETMNFGQVERFQPRVRDDVVKTPPDNVSQLEIPTPDYATNPFVQQVLAAA